MVVDEKTYKDLIYKIASEDSGFKKILDERIDMYKEDSFEIEQLKNCAYTFAIEFLLFLNLILIEINFIPQMNLFKL